MRRIRILSTHYLPNNGDVLASWALAKLMEQCCSESDIKFLDYRDPRKRNGELVKVLRPHLNIPQFTLQRYLLFRRFVTARLPFDKDLRLRGPYGRVVKQLRAANIDVLVVGGTGTWRLNNGPFHPSFPNVYWLPPEVSGLKIAFGPHAFPSDKALFDRFREDLRRSLNQFSLIGVRGEFSFKMVRDLGLKSSIPVFKVPDPTLLVEDLPTGVENALLDRGVDVAKPIFGLLVHGKARLCQEISQRFREMGFQVIALGIYNAHADVNLGHVLDPFQWADVFRFLDFCLTDRFHGTAFCVKYNVPFVSIDPRPIKDRTQNKIADFLDDIGLLEECYENVYAPAFDIGGLVNRCVENLTSWKVRIADRVEGGLREQQEGALCALEKVREIVRGE